jgi:SAM-dependent methyltransferase
MKPPGAEPGAGVNAGVGDRTYYDKWYADRDWRFYRSILAQVVEHSEPGPILDLGAGVGYLVECADRWGLDCNGVDGSPAAVEIGCARWPALKLRHHVLSERLPFPDASFQTVVMNQVIEHLEAPVARAAVGEAFRVLRTGGMLFITSPSQFNEYERTIDPTHINMLAPSTLEAMLRAGGFTTIKRFDEPLPLFGSHRLGRHVLGRLMRFVDWDRLSASANARAYK